ncbi:MAG: hypothetical protein WCP15_03340 [bacterium]
MPKSYIDIFKEAKALYFDISYLQCKALNYENIYFSRSGFEHLIRKHRKIRKTSDQIRRFKLLNNVQDVVENGVITDKRYIQKDENRITFWTISKEMKEKTVKVIIRQINNGDKYFLSIMDIRT